MKYHKTSLICEIIWRGNGTKHVIDGKAYLESQFVLDEPLSSDVNKFICINKSFKFYLCRNKTMFLFYMIGF